DSGPAEWVAVPTQVMLMRELAGVRVSDHDQLQLARFLLEGSASLGREADATRLHVTAMYVALALEGPDVVVDAIRRANDHVRPDLPQGRRKACSLGGLNDELQHAQLSLRQRLGDRSLHSHGALLCGHLIPLSAARAISSQNSFTLSDLARSAISRARSAKARGSFFFSSISESTSGFFTAT